MYPAISIIFSFDFFSVHDVLIILLTYHISAASSLLSRSFVSVQHSYRCRRMDHNYVGFRSVDFGVNLIFLSVKMDFILVNVSSDKTILFFISVSHLTSGVIVKLKYLKVSTCFNTFILSPLQRMLHTGISDCFEMTMHSVFFAFS